MTRGDVRRPRVIGAQGRASALAHKQPMAFDLPWTLVIEVAPSLTVVDDFWPAGFPKALSALFDEDRVVTLWILQEGKTRIDRWLMIQENTQMVREAGVHCNVTKRSWD